MITIRSIEQKDLEPVGKIFDQYWSYDFRANVTLKLEKYFSNDRVLKDQHFRFFVAEKDGEIVGVDAIRNLPDHMKEFASTTNPAEWYVAAVKKPSEGIGAALVAHKLEVLKNEGYTEVLLFSGESHQDAWGFHDKHFRRVGPMRAPNGEPGYVWGKVLV